MAYLIRRVFLPLVLFSAVGFVSPASLQASTPRLGLSASGVGGRRSIVDGLLNDVEILYYTQTIDHFNYRPESYATFQQRYAVNFKYWGGANTSSPIFLYTGDEGGLYTDMFAAGFFTDNAAHFKALLVYVEHRYYGESIPFGSREEAFGNATTLGFFNSAQALADYAELIKHLKKNLSAEYSPVIAAGGSYGRMLAAWFRLKYPHIAYGALASSAPILYFDDITPQNGYFLVVSKDFKEASESCYNTIKQSWSEIDKIASQSNGLAVLSEKFMTCGPLHGAAHLKVYLKHIFTSSAQYDYPPDYPVDQICKAIDDSAVRETDILDQIFAGVVAIKEPRPCYNTSESSFPPELLEGWMWQTCSEMVMPISSDGNDTMFQPYQFDLEELTRFCKSVYGVPPRPHWITTEFGGHDIKLVLKRFGSNIIFSNGLRDPYSIGGVLENISDSVVASYTTQGAHCLDLLPITPDSPQWLVSQRNSHVKIIEGWIQQYNSENL